MKKSLLSVLFMFTISLVFTALVSGIRFFSENRIRINRELKLQNIILKVLDIPVPENTSDIDQAGLFASRVRTLEVQGTTLYMGYEADGITIRGYAFPVGGPGFWGPIEGMMAVNAEASRLLGLAFSKHSETPGLGGRITESWFTDQFKDIPLYPIEGGEKFFTLKTPGTATEGATPLDAVTGATNTSAAVEALLNDGIDGFLKNLKKDLDMRR